MYTVAYRGHPDEAHHIIYNAPPENSVLLPVLTVAQVAPVVEIPAVPNTPPK